MVLVVYLFALVTITRAEKECSPGPSVEIVVCADLDLTLWATSPSLFNPTNIDTDVAGRIWVMEGVYYQRAFHRPESDHIMVLEERAIRTAKQTRRTPFSRTQRSSLR